MNRDPEDDGDDNDDCGNQQVANHWSIRSRFSYRNVLPRVAHMNSTRAWSEGGDPQERQPASNALKAGSSRIGSRSESPSRKDRVRSESSIARRRWAMASSLRPARLSQQATL